jgi:undecaprenyl-diphosphatase
MDFLQSFDQGALLWFDRWQRPWLGKVMNVLTLVGNTLPLLVVAVLAALVFMARGRWRSAALLLLAVEVGSVLSIGVKEYVGRQRPDMGWRVGKLPSSPSFPSGRALGAMSTYATLGMLASRRLRSRLLQGVLIADAVALALAIGVSRMYLAHHWPTDVIAGWSAGLGCALLAYWADCRWGSAERNGGEAYSPRAAATKTTAEATRQ